MEEEVDVWQQKGLYVAMVWQQEGLYVAARGFICGSKCGSSVAATRVSGHVFPKWAGWQVMGYCVAVVWMARAWQVVVLKVHVTVTQ